MVRSESRDCQRKYRLHRTVQEYKEEHEASLQEWNTKKPKDALETGKGIKKCSKSDDRSKMLIRML